MRVSSYRCSANTCGYPLHSSTAREEFSPSITNNGLYRLYTVLAHSLKICLGVASLNRNRLESSLEDWRAIAQPAGIL